MNSIVNIRRHRSGVVLSPAARDGQASAVFVAPKNPHVFQRIRVHFSWCAVAPLTVGLSIRGEWRCERGIERHDS
jgi:hypothetical protein